MTYTLSLSPGLGFRHGGPMAPDEPYWFEVLGMPPGLEADVVKVNGTWRVGIVEHGQYTRWPDVFPDAASGLVALQARYGDQKAST